MKPYPKYKDSVIEWLGEVPEHWKQKTIAKNFKFACLLAGGTDTQFFGLCLISIILFLSKGAPMS
jgi:hypothetical protein